MESNKTEVLSFDEWLDTTKLRGYIDENSLEASWEAGQQSKQGEVDKLQAEVDEYKEVAQSMEDAYLREKAKVDELQKRVKELELINFDSELHFDAAKEHIDHLQKKIDDALKAMDGESVNSWGLWKEKGDMYEQGASNAYEKSYWILKGKTNGQ